MNDTTPLKTALKSIGLADLLTGFRHKGGNVYGRLQFVPIDNTPAPVLRLVTRSDVAAVHGSKWRAA